VILYVLMGYIIGTIVQSAMNKCFAVLRTTTEKICEIFSYTLIPNHFHFVIKTKSKEECSKTPKAMAYAKVRLLAMDVIA